jgi:hypothetical protein
VLPPPLLHPVARSRLRSIAAAHHAFNNVAALSPTRYLPSLPQPGRLLPNAAAAPVHRPLTSPPLPCPHKTASAPCLPSVPHRKLPVAPLLRLSSSGVNPGHWRCPGVNLGRRRHSGVNPSCCARRPRSGDHWWRRLMATLIAAAGPGWIFPCAGGYGSK